MRLGSNFSGLICCCDCGFGFVLNDCSAAQVLRRLVDDGGSSSGGEEVEHLSNARPAIEPIDHPDREVEEKILAFFHIDKQLESYYWNCRYLALRINTRTTITIVTSAGDNPV